MSAGIEVIVQVVDVSIIATIPMKVVEVGGTECPVITLIDGGNATGGFAPVNGNLDGGGA